MNLLPCPKLEPSPRRTVRVAILLLVLLSISQMSDMLDILSDSEEGRLTLLDSDEVSLGHVCRRTGQHCILLRHSLI